MSRAASRGVRRYVAPHQALRAGFATLGRLLPEVAGELALRRFTRPRRHPPRDWEVALLGRGTRVPIPDAPALAASAWGPDGAPTVLLVHGWEGRGSQLGAFVEPLLARGFRVVALDAPAHGHSAGVDANPLVFMRAILATARALGPLAGVVGHSMGGAATVIALDRGLEVERVALLGAPAWLSRVVTAFPRLLHLPPRAAASFARRLERHVGASADAVDPARLVERGVREARPWTATAALVVHDAADADVPLRDAEELVQRWPSARLERVDVGGHRRMLFAPSVLELVAGHLAGAARPLTGASQ